MSEFQKIYHCAKRPIDVWTNYLYYNLSMRLVWLIRNTKVTPNQLTLFALFLATIGCLFFADGSRTMVIVGLVLVQLSYVFDCADGQMARYKQMFSPIGGWLDQMSDRVKEFLVYFSLAFGYTRFHHDASIWMWTTVGLFSLYMLEYYGQIMKTYKPKMLAAASFVDAQQVVTPVDETATSSEASQPASTFSKLRHLRSFVPFHGFNIGEQYAAMLIFIAFGAIYSFFVFTACLGVLMIFYRPAIDFMKIRRGTL